jgi:hypothetical protein
VRFFIDECLSPQLAIRLNSSGRHDAVHPLHVGRRGAPDRSVLAWCIEEDRIIVTQNARDRVPEKTAVPPITPASWEMIDCYISVGYTPSRPHVQKPAVRLARPGYGVRPAFLRRANVLPWV